MNDHTAPPAKFFWPSPPVPTWRKRVRLLGIMTTFASHLMASLLTSHLMSSHLVAGNAIWAQEISDSQFLGTKTESRITQRFEIYDPHSRQELQAVKEMGFTQVILDWPNLHQEATELGLDVVLANWWTDKTPPAKIERGIEVAHEVAKGQLAGISIMDEPQRNSPDTPFAFYVDLYQKLRARMDQELPGVKLEISHWGPLASWDRLDYHLFADLYRAADVMRIMPYPDLDEGDLANVFLMMQRSRALMRKADRDLPLLVILQAWTLPPKSELPTIAELRVMAYQAMLGGADTLSFYHYRPEEWAKTPGFHAGFEVLMNELQELSRTFAAADIEATLHENGILEARLSSPLGLTTIRVNTQRKGVAGLAALEIKRTDEHVGSTESGSALASGPARRPWMHRKRVRRKIQCNLGSSRER